MDEKGNALALSILLSVGLSLGLTLALNPHWFDTQEESPHYSSSQKPTQEARTNVQDITINPESYANQTVTLTGTYYRRSITLIDDSGMGITIMNQGALDNALIDGAYSITGIVRYTQGFVALDILTAKKI